MANINIKDLVNVSFDLNANDLHDEVLQKSIYDAMEKQQLKMYEQVMYHGYPKTLQINLDSIHYNYEEILQHIASELDVYAGNFSGPVMDAAAAVQRHVHAASKYPTYSHMDTQHDNLRAVAAALNRAVGYHYVMSMLMKYMKDEDLEKEEWSAIMKFMYNKELKPYVWDVQHRLYRIQKQPTP